MLLDLFVNGVLQMEGFKSYLWNHPGVTPPYRVTEQNLLMYLDTAHCG